MIILRIGLSSKRPEDWEKERGKIKDGHKKKKKGPQVGAKTHSRLKGKEKEA